MKRFSAIAASLAAILIAAPAYAGMSCYGGVTAGYSVAHTDASLDVDTGSGPVSLLAIDGLSADGATGGLLAGCDYRFDRIVIGAWGDYTWHGAEFEVTSALVPGTLAELSIDRQWSAGGRAGLMVTDSALVYGLVGFTRVSTGDLESPALGASLTVDDFDGIVYGGGLEVDIGSGLMLGAEYRYTDLDDQNVPEGSPIYLNLDPGIHTARAVMKYRFDFSPQTY